MTPWPPVRIGAVIGIGLLGIYALGRWEARVDAGDAALEAQTRTVLAQARVSRVLRDSLREVEDALLLRDQEIADATARHRRSLAALVEQGRREVEELEVQPVDSLLRSLRMRPIRVSPDTTLYATDSSGVVVLARGMLRLHQLDRQRVVLDSLAAADATRIAGLVLVVATARLRADTAESDLEVSQALLEGWLNRSQCRILWLIPCPSRTVTLLVGVAAGGVAILVLKE
jgi:hypothetical protein